MVLAFLLGYWIGQSSGDPELAFYKSFYQRVTAPPVRPYTWTDIRDQPGRFFHRKSAA